LIIVKNKTQKAKALYWFVWKNIYNNFIDK